MGLGVGTGKHVGAEGRGKGACKGGARDMRAWEGGVGMGRVGKGQGCPLEGAPLAVAMRDGGGGKGPGMPARRSAVGCASTGARGGTGPGGKRPGGKGTPAGGSAIPGAGGTALRSICICRCGPCIRLGELT